MYSKVIQVYIYMYLFFFIFFSYLGCYIILNRVPCAVQQVLVLIYFKYSSVCMSIPNALILPPPTLFPVTISLCSKPSRALLNFKSQCVPCSGKEEEHGRELVHPQTQ